MQYKSLANKLAFIGSFLALTALTSCAHDSTNTSKDNSSMTGVDNPHILYSGRSAKTDDGKIAFGYSGARIRAKFFGSSIAMRMWDDSGENYVLVWIDGVATGKLRLDASDGLYQLADDLPCGEHTVEVVRITECSFGLIRFGGFELNDGARLLEWDSANRDRKIEFIGDSITCGYGIEADDPELHFEAATENFCLGYSSLAARALDADYLVVSRSGIGMLRNFDGPYEGSEDTMPDVYPHTFYLQPDSGWDFSRFTPDLVCINLGTNDFSTSGVNVEKFVARYTAFAKVLLDNYPKARLLVLQGPMENGDSLRDALGRVVAALEDYAPGRVSYFKLSAQGSLGYGADYHPNREQAKVNAAELSAHVAELMGWH